MTTESNFEILLDAMAEAKPEYDRVFSLSIIERMSDPEKHRLQTLQNAVLPADQRQMLERRTKEGFGDADFLADHDRAVEEAFTIIAAAATRFAGERVTTENPPIAEPVVAEEAIRGQIDNLQETIAGLTTLAQFQPEGELRNRLLVQISALQSIADAMRQALDSAV